MVYLNAYLNFLGKGKEAMEFYKSIFDGELVAQTYGEAGQAKDDSEKDFLMHGELKTENFTFYASDGNKEHPVTFGNSVHLCLGGDDEEKLTKWFNALSEGGEVDMPLAKQFWGDTYGQLTDKYGIHWMVNIAAKK
ncbi:MAG TPA: VOC family protein [Candidatus Saccharimonadales bacterium]|nr:VOC family protein [Candidatus Saccharimonadales bacterium]